MKKLFFYLAVLILCFQLVSATVTNIQVKTVPLKNVNVQALSSSMNVYDRFNKDADEYGDVSFVFSSDESRFDLSIFVKDLILDEKVAYKKLENQVAGEDIYVEVIPAGFNIIKTPIEEDISADNLTETSENVSSNDTGNLITVTEKSDKKSFLSGLVIFGENNKLKKIILYSFGGIVLVLIIFFIIRRFRRKNRTGKEIKVKKLSELRAEQKEETPENYHEMLEDAQRKLEDTQRELNQLKNQDKIRETEKKLQQDQQELRKLKGF